jgi:hypothetical protein
LLNSSAGPYNLRPRYRHERRLALHEAASRNRASLALQWPLGVLRLSLPQACRPQARAALDDEHPECFIVRDATGQALAYVYFEGELDRRSAAHLLTRDEARRIAANIGQAAGAVAALASRVAQPPTATQTRESTTAVHNCNWRERKRWRNRGYSKVVAGAGSLKHASGHTGSALTCGSVTPITGVRLSSNEKAPRRSAGPSFGGRPLCARGAKHRAT